MNLSITNLSSIFRLSTIYIPISTFYLSSIYLSFGYHLSIIYLSSFYHLSIIYHLPLLLLNHISYIINHHLSAIMLKCSINIHLRCNLYNNKVQYVIYDVDLVPNLERRGHCDIVHFHRYRYVHIL